MNQQFCLYITVMIVILQFVFPANFISCFTGSVITYMYDEGMSYHFYFVGEGGCQTIFFTCQLKYIFEIVSHVVGQSSLTP